MIHFLFSAFFEKMILTRSNSSSPSGSSKKVRARLMFDVLALLLVAAIVTSSIHQYANASTHHHIGTPDNSGSSRISGSDGTTSSGVITNDSDVGVIPGEAPNQDISVGILLQGCYGVVSDPTAPTAGESKPHCDLVVGYIVNYCMDHMNDTMARENNQVCWNHNVMEEALRYAVA